MIRNFLRVWLKNLLNRDLIVGEEIGKLLNLNNNNNNNKLRSSSNKVRLNRKKKRLIGVKRKKNRPKKSKKNKLRVVDRIHSLNNNSSKIGETNLGSSVVNLNNSNSNNSKVLVILGILM